MGVYLRVDEPVPYLCFTAEEANSTVKLQKYSQYLESPSLEISRDGIIWTDYTWQDLTTGTEILLNNIGDKVYWRNKSETTTNFSNSSYYHYFGLTGKIAASGDITYLINKNGTKTLYGDYTFQRLFSSAALTSAPKLPATTITQGCYYRMFSGCTNLKQLSELPATNLQVVCYTQMYYGCSSIKLSTTQTGEYQTAYRIPETGTGTEGTNSLLNMLADTGGTFTGTPSINTTYYTSNTKV